VVDLLKLFLCGEEDAIYRIKDRQFANIFALVLDLPTATLQQEAARSGDLSAALSQVCLRFCSSRRLCVDGRYSGLQLQVSKQPRRRSHRARSAYISATTQPDWSAQGPRGAVRGAATSLLCARSQVAGSHHSEGPQALPGTEGGSCSCAPTGILRCAASEALDHLTLLAFCSAYKNCRDLQAVVQRMLLDGYTAASSPAAASDSGQNNLTAIALNSPVSPMLAQYVRSVPCCACFLITAPRALKSADDLPELAPDETFLCEVRSLQSATLSRLR
jgi:hypothetical protein